MSKLTICCAKNDFTHEFLTYEDRDKMADQIRKVIEEDCNSVLTLGTDESQFIYPLEFVRKYCFIRVDSYDSETNESSDKPPGGKVISIDFTKKK